MNNQRYLSILATIEANPQHWVQTNWHCQTSHCFAGFAELEMLRLQPFAHESNVVRKKAQFLRNAEIWSFSPHINGREYLELTEGQASWLFSANRTLSDFRHVRRMICR